MTPEQKIKSAILAVVARWNKQAPAVLSADNVDAVYDETEPDHIQDAKEEIRGSGIKTGLPCEWSSHYESKAVAAKMPDGSWVGWTYWYGGGKHGEPSSIDWMDDAYDLECTEEEQVVTVRKFTEPGASSET